MPKLVRLYIQSVALGFAVSAGFTAGLLWLDVAGIAPYVTLVKRATHVDGTLGMMAAWRVDRLMAGAASLTVPLTLITTAGDRIVPSRISRDAARMLPRAEVRDLPTLGHLAHEEDAGAILRAIGDRLV